MHSYIHWGTLRISSSPLLSKGSGFEFRTRACRTAGRRTTIWYFLQVHQLLVISTAINKNTHGPNRKEHNVLIQSIEYTICTASYTAKNQYHKFETNIPRKGTARPTVPISTFMCLWAIYIFLWSICFFCCRRYVDRSWKYISCSQTQNVEIGTEAAQFQEKEYINGIFVAV